MNFFQAVVTCFTNYVGFDGRAPRSEYWYWVLFVALCNIALGLIQAQIVGIAFPLLTTLPHMAVAARRLHDIDKSGWWQLLGFVPIVGWIVLTVWFCRRGDPGMNRFGADPLGTLQAA